jgi:hypothetical protein
MASQKGDVNSAPRQIIRCTIRHNESMFQTKTRRLRLSLLAGFVVVVLFFGHGILASRGTFVPLRPAQEAGGNSVMVGRSGHRIAGRVYLTGAHIPDAPLVVVLHGDAPGNKPGYQYALQTIWLKHCRECRWWRC